MQEQKVMNFNANTITQAKEYLKERYKELASIGISVDEEIIFEDKAIITIYNNNYGSIYILEQFRGNDLFRKLIQIYQIPIITMKDCELEEYLNYIGCRYIIVEPSKAYQLIKNYYGNRVAKRSGVPLINHIDEGIEILNSIKADSHTIDAYCLHPLLQSDKDFNSNIGMDFSGISTQAIILAVEYRRVANSYLSNMERKDFVGFTNRRIEQMLYADKLQNEKDFKLYHEETHERSQELREYFNNWFELLNINF